MRRYHFFEFEDQAWFPSTIRNYVTDFLRDMTILLGLDKKISALLNEFLEKAEQDSIVDLCSGGGGLLVKIQDNLTVVYNKKIEVTLTDKYPNELAINTLAKKGSKRLFYESESIDVLNIPDKFKGMRTLFSSFHHFKPGKAKEILENAHAHKKPIAIFEVSQRSFIGLIPMLLSPLGVVLFTPIVKPFSIGRIVFTYIIPLVPFFVMFDGFVSALRTYTVNEMLELAKGLNDGYIWEANKVSAPFGYKVTYLFGCPDSTGPFGKMEQDSV